MPGEVPRNSERGRALMAHAHVQRLRVHRDRLFGEAVQAREATQQALRLDNQDAVRYTGARVTFASRLDLLRAQLATKLAQREADPDSTSQIIRELRSRRAAQPPEISPAIPPAQLTE